MSIFFYAVTIIQIIEICYSYKKTKRIISIPNVFFVGVSINFILYLCNWSSLFIVKCLPVTYMVIGGCTLVVVIFDLIYLKKNKNIVNSEPISLDLSIMRLRFGSIRIHFSTVVFLICFSCAAIENFMMYHTLFPFLYNIDSHKYSSAVFGTLWKALYPVGFFSFYFEQKRVVKKKIVSYIILLLTSIYLLIGGGSRFWTFVTILSFVFFYFINVRKNIKLKTVIFVVLVGTQILRVFLLMGMTRLQSAYTYMELIGYNGPFKNTIFSNAMSWFYGYFPYSFYNLNLTLQNIQNNGICTYGQFFMLPFLYLTKLYKLTSLDYSELALSVRVISNTSATVATAFFEFYSYFKYFFFLPMVFYCFCMYQFQSKNTLFSQGAYAYCLACLFLFSFYNVFSPGIPYTFILLWYLFNKLLIRKCPMQNSVT